MANISLRALMQCVDVSSQSQSVLRQLFGFHRGRVPPDPTGVTSSVSLRELAGDLDGNHLHLNVIRVGFGAFSANDFDDAMVNIDYAIYRIRNIYRPQGVGVGRVQHYLLEPDPTDSDDPVEDFADIDDSGEARELWEKYQVFNDGIDAFVVRSITGFLGVSPVGGDCGKDSKDDGMLAGGVDSDPEGMSRTFAHEVGHFLDLPHNHSALPTGPCPTTAAGMNNLMAQTGCITIVAALSDTRNAVLLTNGQGNKMRDHCTVKAGCS